jgi:hypothetical protein
MNFFEGLSPQAVSVGTALFTAAVTIIVASIKLLVNRFDNLATAIKEQGRQLHEWLMDHEEKDQQRHEDNLIRFQEIAVKLAQRN